ncbi:MAG: hypothetical protein Q7T83_11255 [Thermodesulfovibrionales bacterium]|nr:hypothetical protein [Thermodesulfovibrionales bacterium]
MIPFVILLLSIVMQLAAAIYALLLIRITGRKSAWILISMAMVLMTSRRIVSFVSILTSDKKFTYEISEIIALIIAFLMLFGVLRIRSYFWTIKSAENERKQAEEEREQIILELKDALAKVKQLSGMLPICASCKKIRDDKGYWKQVEVYISEHTDTMFSHGMCPDCAKKAYEELDELKKKNT